MSASTHSGVTHEGVTHAEGWAYCRFVSLVSTSSTVELTLSGGTKAVGQAVLTRTAAEADTVRVVVARPKLSNGHRVWCIADGRHSDAL